MNSVIKMAVIASPAGAELRSETGSDSDGLVSKSRGAKLVVWVYFWFEADRKTEGPVCCDLSVAQKISISERR